MGQTSGAKGTRGEVVVMEVLEAEAPSTVLGASSLGSEDSKTNGAIAGAATGHLRDRLTGSVLIAVEAGRFLRPSVAGGGATGTPRVADTGAAAATSELAGELTSLLLTGPEQTGGDIKVAGAIEMVEGLSTASWMAPTDETGVSFKPVFGEAGI